MLEKILGIPAGFLWAGLVAPLKPLPIRGMPTRVAAWAAIPAGSPAARVSAWAAVPALEATGTRVAAWVSVAHLGAPGTRIAAWVTRGPRGAGLTRVTAWASSVSPLSVSAGHYLIGGVSDPLGPVVRLSTG